MSLLLIVLDSISDAGSIPAASTRQHLRLLTSPYGPGAVELRRVLPDGGVLVSTVWIEGMGGNRLATTAAQAGTAQTTKAKSNDFALPMAA